MQIIIWLKLSLAQNSHLGAKKYPLSHSNACKRDGLNHTLSMLDPVFWVLWGPLGPNPLFDLTGVTAYIRHNACPNFVLLALLVPEIMRLKGVVTS